LTNEADDLARAAGFPMDYSNLSSDDDEQEKSIEDTQWSGQSDLDIQKETFNNYEDIKNRPVLAVGDVLALLAFSFVGRGNHDEGLDIFGITSTAAPFVLSWLAITPFLGAYSSESTASKGGVPGKLLPGWIVAVPLALALRGALKGYIPPTAFIIVSMVSTLGFISAWRVLYILTFGETGNAEYRNGGFLEVFKMVGTLVKRW
jgi:hypothetical protein